jgi:simple sugar transport system ATP-binding protein
MVFQHFSLFESLTVEENVALGIGKDRARDDLAGQIRDLGQRYGLTLDPARTVASLSVGERQRVEIVRSLLQNPRLVIMDEPTSVLTPQEVETLFQTLRTLASEGRSILYISHKLEEIRVLCSRATILRGGRKIATCAPGGETNKSLAEMMLGQSFAEVRRTAERAGVTVLEAERLSLPAEGPHDIALRDISLTVRSGDIVGIAGLAGNGQDELMRVLIGERAAPEAAMIRVDGLAIGHKTPSERRRLAMGFVPEERFGHGAVPTLSLIENTLLTGAERVKLVDERGFIDWSAARAFAERVVAAFDVRTPGVDHPASALSGGNAQKFIVGREVLQGPRVLVVAQPTWGVDAGAAAAIHQQLFALARTGAAILVISQDLDELMRIASRIGVMAQGRLSPLRDTGTLTAEIIGLEMGGHAAGTTAADGGAHVPA